MGLVISLQAVLQRSAGVLLGFLPVDHRRGGLLAIPAVHLGLLGQPCKRELIRAQKNYSQPRPAAAYGAPYQKGQERPDLDGVLLRRQGRHRQTQGNPAGHRPRSGQGGMGQAGTQSATQAQPPDELRIRPVRKGDHPGKSIRTQSDNHKELKQLRRAFENVPIESITPQVIAQYRDARTTKVRANREIALLSHAFTIAREWGLTDKANPCFGVRRNKEKPRDYYAGETVWNAVYAEAAQELKDAMDLAYLTGQRPADVLKIAATDLNNGFLLIGQGKTEKRLRLRLEEEGVQSELSAFIEDLQERRAINGIRTSTLITNAPGLRMSQQMLRNRWDDAREKAAIKAAADGDPALAVSIRQFQFKEIRPKAASEIELTHASRLLGHSTEEMTKKVYRRVGEIVKPTK